MPRLRATAICIALTAACALACWTSAASAATAVAASLTHCSSKGLRGVSDLEAGAFPGAYQQYGADCGGARDAASKFISSQCSKMSVSFRTKDGKYAICTNAYDKCAVHRAPTTAQPKVVGIECEPIANGNALIAFTYKFSH